MKGYRATSTNTKSTLLSPSAPSAPTKTFAIRIRDCSYTKMIMKMKLLSIAWPRKVTTKARHTGERSSSLQRSMSSPCTG